MNAIIVMYGILLGGYPNTDTSITKENIYKSIEILYEKNMLNYYHDTVLYVNFDTSFNFNTTHIEKVDINGRDVEVRFSSDKTSLVQFSDLIFEENQEGELYARFEFNMERAGYKEYGTFYFTRYKHQFRYENVTYIIAIE